MPYVRSPDGKTIGTVPAEDYDKALVAGYTPVSDREVESAQKATPKGGIGEALGTAGEGFVKGAVGTFTAPLRGAGALAETIAGGPTPTTDALRGATGENALAALHTVGSYLGDIPSAIGEGRLPQAESDQATQSYIRGEKNRAEAHGVASGIGEFAGGALGLAPTLGAGAAATTGGFVGEGAGIGATQAIAQASDEARDRNSALTGEHAAFVGGLGALLGGTLNFAGKKVNEYLLGRAAKTLARNTVPELEVPPEGVSAPRTPQPFGEGGIPDAIPELEVPPPSPEMARTIPAPPTTNAEVMAGMAPPLEREGGMGLSPPYQGPEGPPTVPAPPTTNAEVVNGKSQATPAPDFFQKGLNFPAEAQNYNPYTGSIAEEGGLSMRGELGGETGIEGMQRGLGSEDMNARARSAKVAQLYNSIPDGVRPEWLEDATPKQREQIARWAGVPEASDETWQALIDHVAQQSGLPSGNSEPIQGAVGVIPPEVRGSTGILPPPPPETAAAEPDLGGKFPPIQAPWAREYPPGEANPMAGFSPTPEISPPTPSKAYKAATGGPADESTIGESIAGKAVLGGPGGGEGGNPRSRWDSFLNRISRYGARKLAAHAVGSVVGGGAFGPVAYFGGLAAGELYNRMSSGATLGRLANRGVEATTAALGRALGEITSANASKAIPSATSIFLGKSKDPEKAYDQRVKELQAAQNTPGLIADKVGAAYGPLGHEEQAGVFAVTQAAERGVDYLLQNRPQADPNYESLTPNADATKPSRADLADYARTYAAVMHPMTVIRDIANGTVVKDQIDAIKAVYPTIYQQQIVDPLNSMLRDRDAKNKPLLPPQQRVADIILGTNTGINSDKFVLKYGPQFAQALSSQQPGGQSTTPKAQGRKLQGSSAIVGSYQNQTSNMLGTIK